MNETPEMITFDEFSKLDLRVGTVVEAREHPDADKLLILQVDLGFETRQLVAGLKQYYAAEAMVGKQIVVVANLKPRKMRGEESRGMLLAATSPDESRVIFLSPEAEIDPGSKVS